MSLGISYVKDGDVILTCLDYVDDETCRLERIENPFEPKVSRGIAIASKHVDDSFFETVHAVENASLARESRYFNWFGSTLRRDNLRLNARERLDGTTLLLPSAACQPKLGA
jgi:hypothetical protein